MISDIWVSNGPLFSLQLEDGTPCPQPRGWVVIIDENPEHGWPRELKYVFLDLDGTRREYRSTCPPVDWKDHFSIAAS